MFREQLYVRFNRTGAATGIISFVTRPSAIVNHMRHILESATEQATPSHFDLLTPAARKMVNAMHEYDYRGG